MSGSDRTITVRVPATSANLGPGYDSFGLALARYDEITGRLAARTTVTVEGPGADSVPRDASHLVVRAVAAAFDAAGVEFVGIALDCRNTIPHGGGQGSSAAAIVSGLLLGRALLPDGSVLTDEQLLASAAAMEGHPDNVAPALLGGFTLAWTGLDGRVQAVRVPVHPAVRAVLFTAASAASTEHARSLLPSTVPHADAAANAAAAGLLTVALRDRPDLLLEATADRLHQQYRAPAMPATFQLVSDLRAAGVPAVVSGAGPSVLALSGAELDPEPFVREGFRATAVAIDSDGAVVVAG